MSRILERGRRLADFLENGRVSGDVLQSRAATTVRELVAEIELYQMAIREAQTCANMAEARELFTNTLTEFK